MLLVMMLLMSSYTSAFIEIADVLPSSNIDFANRTFLTIKLKSYMKKLEFLNPPAEVNMLAIFRCSAYIGAPFGATDFLWIHETKHHKLINVNKVHVRPYGKCLSPAVSLNKIVIREGEIGTEQQAIRDNAVIEIADVFPSSNIDFAHATFLTIKCRYDIKNLLQFFLVRNHSEVVVQIDLQLKSRIFEVVTRRKGFDCTVPTFPADKKGVVTCSKRYPSCEDATYYKCSTNRGSSKPRLVRVRSFMKKLEFLNPPAEVNKLAIFRCSAYIGAPFGATDFLWSHETKHHKWINQHCLLLAIFIKDFGKQAPAESKSVIEIADVLPSSNIDFANRTFLTIKCRYAIKNLIQFFLVRNHSEVIVQIDFQCKKAIFEVVTKKKGFDCTVPTFPADKKGVITCTKRYPSCEDATYYKCSTNEGSSKPRVVRVRSYMKKLEFLNPPAKVNMLAIFRCSAYIGAPFGATDFLWSHETKHHKWINVKEVDVRPHGMCLSPAASLKKFVIREGDIGNSSVSCSVYSESRTLQLTSKTAMEIVDTKPSETIDFGYTTGMTITCRYNLKNVLYFALVQNLNYIVFKTHYVEEERKFLPVIKRKGFDCTLDHIKNDEVTCWKFNPTCDDAAYYSCKTNLESSKVKALKARSYINKLQVLNPPAEKGKTMFLRCTAYVGAPLREAYFIWNAGSTTLTCFLDGETLSEKLIPPDWLKDYLPQTANAGAQNKNKRINQVTV
ncbi:Hypothetical predicted protein [Octopus vulgaris]|uniref:Uncharacterized protein n=1 Tax=Octopus vulgaris TaxID=6645 RepID=A0AA36BNL7_OCTVU|nr:Hypothetical predicted protein [Octopus vulgaris]